VRRRRRDHVDRRRDGVRYPTDATRDGDGELQSWMSDEARVRQRKHAAALLAAYS
jgi:hypothetical protein